MRSAFLLFLLLPAWIAAAQEAPTAGQGTAVFSGGGEAPPPREKPTKPVTTYWRVQLFVKMADAPVGAHAQVLLPLADAHQQILARRVESDGFTYREEPEPPNLWGVWTRTAAPNGTQFQYEVNVALTDTIETIPDLPLGELTVPDALKAYVQPSMLMQSTDPELRRRGRDLIKESRTVEAAAWALF